MIKNKAEHIEDLNFKLTSIITKLSSVKYPNDNPIMFLCGSHYSEKFHVDEEPEYIEGVTSGKVLLDLRQNKTAAVELLSKVDIKFSDKGRLQVPGTERPEKNSGNAFLEVDLTQQNMESKIDRAHELVNAAIMVEKYNLLDNYIGALDENKPKTKEEFRTLLMDMAEYMGLEKPLFKGNGTEPKK